MLGLLFDESRQSTGAPKISNKEAIDHYKRKYKAGKTHYKYFMRQKTKVLDVESNYANRAFNRAS